MLRSLVGSEMCIRDRPSMGRPKRRRAAVNSSELSSSDNEDAPPSTHHQHQEHEHEQRNHDAAELTEDELNDRARPLRRSSCTQSKSGPALPPMGRPKRRRAAVNYSELSSSDNEDAPPSTHHQHQEHEHEQRNHDAAELTEDELNDRARPLRRSSCTQSKSGPALPPMGRPKRRKQQNQDAVELTDELIEDELTHDEPTSMQPASAPPVPTLCEAEDLIGQLLVGEDNLESLLVTAFGFYPESEETPQEGYYFELRSFEDKMEYFHYISHEEIWLYCTKGPHFDKVPAEEPTGPGSMVWIQLPLGDERERSLVQAPPSRARVAPRPLWGCTTTGRSNAAELWEPGVCEPLQPGHRGVGIHANVAETRQCRSGSLCW
eukprot:TRINITY_DN9811_c0_g1_i6.p1 TRINITY_DN9811_c0_g1~~TRINITY_DN9811_c0_g1_i6.p1  ORF type:complete len:413 (+),score=43.11 TRINITY_DN9811_c0_g1_i6:110-1240(+)